MRRPYQGQGDNRDLRGPPEPDDGTNQFRNALSAAKSERRAQDEFVRFGVLPEPPPRDRKVFVVLSLLGLVLLVAAVSAYVGMTFMPRWLAAMKDTPAEASAEVPPPAPTRPRAAAPQLAGVQSIVPSAPSVAVAAVQARSPGPAVQGVTDTEIRFGMAAPFAGPAKEMGRQLKLGIETAFAAANDNGGVDGRQLKLVTADDGYEPTRTLNAMKELTRRTRCSDSSTTTAVRPL